MTISSPVVESFSSVEELDEANRQAGWQLEYRQLEAAPFSAEFAGRPCGETLLMRELFCGSLEIVGEPPVESVGVMLPGNPTRRATFNGREVRDDRLFVAMPGSEIDVTALGSLEVYSMYVPASAFENAARPVCLLDMAKLLGSALAISASAPRLAPLRRLFAAGLGAGALQEIACHEFLANLTDKIVKLMAGSETDDSMANPYDGSSNRHRLIGARDYIEAHLADVIRMPQVCRSVGISLRGLERLFARELGISPTKYVRARRLNAVRRRLIAADAESTRVGDVASTYGFSHLGRFAGEYRSYFGETPHQTLKDAKPRAA